MSSKYANVSVLYWADSCRRFCFGPSVNRVFRSLSPPNTASVQCMYIFAGGGGGTVIHTSDVMGKNAEVCWMSIYASMSDLKL